jgi:membrane-bound lytic murein transglycosylase A
MPLWSNDRKLARSAPSVQGENVASRILAFVFLILFALLQEASAQASPSGALPFSDDLEPHSLRAAIHRSLDYLQRLPSDRVVGVHPRAFTALEIADSLRAFDRRLHLWNQPQAFAEAVLAEFDVYPAVDGRTERPALFTGYYQPVIEGSLEESPRYPYPVYGKPGDLIVAEQVTLIPEWSAQKVTGRFAGDRFVQYFSRRDIDRAKALRGRGYEIAWVKDAVALFFLHIQGSGILLLEDGRRLYLNYAASNGRPYRSIGRLLVAQNKIPQEEISMQRLRRYLADHPQERDDIFDFNESYVFFRFAEQGPLGSLDVPLTPGRSIATDSALFPKGALAFIVTDKPVLDADGNLIGWQPFSRFVLNQDTGSAIQGLGRVDLYFGSGPQAGAAAGFMNGPGRLYFLIRKSNHGQSGER